MKRDVTFRLCRFIAAVCLVPIWADAAVEAKPGDVDAGRGQAVQVRDGVISLNATDQALGVLLDEIASQATISFSVPESIAQAPVTDRFEDLPLLEGVRRLLEGRSYLISHVPAQSGDRTVSLRVRILETAGLTGEGGRSRSTPSPDLDDQAVQRAEKLMNLSDEADRGALTLALQDAAIDPHALVREAVLRIIEDMEGEHAPAQLVAQIALQDSVPALRMEALDTMASLIESHKDLVLDTLRQAKKDSDPDVRELASDLIESR